MKRIIVPFIIVLLCASSAAESQIILGRSRMVSRYRHPRQQRNLPKFQPTVNVSFGYGYPNLDKYQFPELVDYYKGNSTQGGPINGSFDYQFSRTSSIGIMVTNGKVNMPYYDYNSSSSDAAINGTLENTSVMLNFVRYMPVGGKVAPYLRTAIGVNIWKENYKDDTGEKVNVINSPQLQDIAYQVALGAKFNLTPKAGIFIEAGYGKYILNGGVAFKF